MEMDHRTKQRENDKKRLIKDETIYGRKRNSKEGRKKRRKKNERKKDIKYNKTINR